MKALKCGGKVDGGRRTFSKQSYIDLPLSPKTFIHLFRNFEIENCGKHRKAKISVDNMREILGLESLVYNQEKSSTHHRILGHVNVLYRTKQIGIFCKDSCSRYRKILKINTQLQCEESYQT